MENHKFSLTIKGSEKEAAKKANALAVLANALDTQTLVALAHVVKTDPQKVALARQFLGIA